MTPEDAVRAYFAAYTQGHPEQFEEVVSPDYVDYGHTPLAADRRVPATTTSMPSSSRAA